MSDSSPHSFQGPPQGKPRKSLIDILASIIGGIAAFVRKAPVFFVFAILAVILYFQQAQQPEEQFPQFDDPMELLKEPKPPEDLSQETASVWTCVHRTDSQLSNGLWADIYYGMEARIDGKQITAKVTEKWRSLSDDKRQTVAQLVVDTWIENGQALRLFDSRDEMEEIVLKQLPEDQTVAAWKPSTGIQLFNPQGGA